MSKIYLQINRGLGDAIIANGLIRELSKFNEHILVPCFDHNLKSIRNMFIDLQNVSLISDTEDVPKDYAILDIGCGNPKFKDFRSFDVGFYELSGIPFEKRWTSFKIIDQSPIKPPKSLYILKHEDPKRGFIIQPRHINPTYPILDIEGSEFLSDYIEMIENALEIHCIDSSMLHLVDSLNPKGQLFYHKYTRNNGPFHQTVKRLKWNVLD